MASKVSTPMILIVCIVSFSLLLMLHFNADKITQIAYPENSKDYLPDNDLKDKNYQYLCTSAIKQKVLHCLLKRLEPAASVYTELNNAMRECSVWLQSTLVIKEVYNRDDVKYMVMPVNYDKNNANTTQCSTLTIGKYNQFHVRNERQNRT